MAEVNETEQWLLSGDCNKCRRKPYCSKPCTIAKRHAEREREALVASLLNEATHGIYGQMLEVASKGRSVNG